MTASLEDHLGDILRKARKMSDVEAAAAAAAAGVSESEWGTLEETGSCAGSLNWTALAGLLGLSAQKLQGIAGGWRPREPDLTTWRELRLFPTTRGGNTVNCYLVWDEVSREGALFDTGWEPAPILRCVEENGLHLKHLFLTHLHEDHIAGMNELRGVFPKMHLHTNSKTVPPQHRNRANDFIHLGSLRISNRQTPGHAEEGAIYLIGTWPEDAPHVAIAGDTLFAGSIATGFQSWDRLKEGIRTQIFSLPADTLLCPGHGPLTTVTEEQAHNPFFP